MTAQVPIQPGQWVLAYVDHFGPQPSDYDLVRALERLDQGGSGWDCLRKAEEQFDILHVERVMPKTFISSTGRWGKGQAKRYPRYLVVGAAPSSGEMLALRDKLFAIGFEADRLIEEEARRLISDFARKTRADALAKIHAALPHIFGRSA
ncbi:hypothetical protein [Mesorhizobium amorphae]|uniref:hypothetical protein n=1 Tax=Mesorhizobium amorphae TaxID=71433 RepID=UPI001181E868|nr:hypothetical protein [Mesorhizobium amorphae]